MEVVNSVLLCQLIMNFETRLEQIFKQLELFRFVLKRVAITESNRIRHSTA